MLKVVLGLAVVVLALLVLYLLFRGDNEVVNAEDTWDGIHLCSPDQQEAATVEARALPTQELRPIDGDSLYFAQTDPAWGNQEYDHGLQQDVGCGKTIAECGCAMTSVATVMRLFEVVSTPDGTQLDPSTLNAWFDQNAQLTNGGWVSQGYTDGAVVWSAINGWKPESGTGSSERDPALRTRSEGVRFVGWGTGSENEIRQDLEAGNPIVLEVKGHYIAAVGLQGDTIMINDPYYRDRTTLDSYAGRILSSRRFEISDDFRMITLSVPSNERVQVMDEQGRVVGTLDGSKPEDAANQASTAIPGSQYHYEAAWRDPTCTERPPPPGTGVNTIFIQEPASGRYHVVVVSKDGGETSAAVHTSDVDGNLKTEAHEGGARLEFDIDYDSGVVGLPISPTPTFTPTPSVTPTPTGTPADIDTLSHGDTDHNGRSGLGFGEDRGRRGHEAAPGREYDYLLLGQP